MTEERLQRALARAGLGSRRTCEELIAHERVTVNGTIAALGDRVDPSRDVVRVDGKRVPLDPELRYFALHKPAGVVTTMRDPGRGALRIVMAEGGKREVRRMLEAVGLPVRRLIRLRVGPVKLGRLTTGAVRELEGEEVRALYRLAGL